MLRIIGLFAVLVVAGCIGAANAAAAVDPMQIGIVTDLGGLNDRSFNAAANLGLERAEANLGVAGTVLESRSDADYALNLTSLANANVGLAIGIGFLMSDAVAEVAAQHPDTNFAIIDFSHADLSDPSGNIAGVTFNERQAGYLAGALAGTAERNSVLRGLNRRHVVGAIGGQSIPPVNRYIGGFRDGVHRTCADCRVLVSYSNDFIDQARCRDRARAQARLGSDIVLVAAGGCGLGAFADARARGTWAIGVDSDASYLGPHVLTSAVKRVDIATYDLIRRNIAGTFPRGQDVSYGVARNGVGLGRIALTARRYQFAVDAALRDLKSGAVR